MARPQSPFIGMKKQPFQRGPTYKKPNLRANSGSKSKPRQAESPPKKVEKEMVLEDEFSSEDFDYDMDDDEFEDLPEVDVHKLIQRPARPNFAKKSGQKYTYNYVKPSE